ncbi:MAG: PD-(D/E)XK nuclease family protein, partial [Clostridia bacterium]|nr:PD-(D/E)XK nuclease family protein [Clostridia bacterium]
EFKSSSPTQSYFDNKKEVHIVSANNDIEEVLFIKQKLSELQNELQTNALDDTAIILNKPENLSLVLSAIPDNIEYNVSMEYPLYLTPEFQFLMQMLRIFVQLDNSKEKQRRIYHKLFVNLILNPFFKRYAFQQLNMNEYIIHSIVKDINRFNKIYISIDDSNIIAKEIFKSEEEEAMIKYNFLKFLALFKENNLEDIIAIMNNLFNTYLVYIMNEKKDIVTMNIIQTICEQLSRIEDILKADKDKGDNRVFKSIRDVFVLVQQILSKEAVAFKGEPLKGLQIIGLLESRLLDFEQVFIPFTNEGIFPPNHQKISFLPFDLRVHYGLPTHYYDDAIFAYLFYRNLHTPSKIFISYNHLEGNDEKGVRSNAGEPSRYIQQIKYELSQKQNIQVKNFTINIADKKTEIALPIVVNKNEQIISKLNQINFSPTSITTYLDCSLKFYFNYVLSLRKTDDTKEDLAADIEGNIFHAVMNKIYSEYKDTIVDYNKIGSLVKDSVRISKMIAEEIKEYNFEHKGKVLIQEEILKRDIITFLKKEIEVNKNKKIKVIYTEKEEKPDLVVFNNRVNLYGIPDRIDYIESENVFRIVDYKSSFSDNYDIMHFNKIQDFLHNTKKDGSINKQIQLLVYVYFAVEKQLIDLNRGSVYALILP